MRGSAFPDMPFSQEISFPCELALRTTPNGPRLFRHPIREIALLRKGHDTWSDLTVKAGETLPLEPGGELFHIQAEVDIPEGAKLKLNIRGVPITLTSKTIESGSSTGAVQDHIKFLEILVDRASVEAFINRGEISSTRFVLPTESGLSLKAVGGSVAIRSLRIHKLKSAWTGAVRLSPQASNTP
jgi:levanase/fructan beta-fructosidase